MPGSSNKREGPDFIIIEDNDKESEVEDEGSRYTKINSSEYRNSSAQHDSGDPNRVPPRPLIDSSDEEDCVVVEPSPSRKPSSSNTRFSDAKKRPRHASHQRFNLRRKIGRPNESSDSDIIVDFNGTVRRDWEEAALRRRMGNMYNSSSFRAESEESASVSNHAKNNGRQSFMGRRRGDTNCFKKPGETDQSNASGVSPAGAGSTHVKEGQDLCSGFDQQSSNPGVLDAQSGDQPIASGVAAAGANSSDGEGVHAASDQQDSNPVVSGAQLDDTVEPTSLAETVPISAGHNVEFFANGSDTVITEADDDLLMESVQKTEEDVGAYRILGDLHVGNTQDTEVAVNPVNGDTIVSGREKLKETEEFRQAVAEEWARRQLELQKQAQEAARERKRRKVEAERKLDMEVRQRQRLEEIRQSQLKEEQTLDLKEQLRGQIHSKLERLGATCRDMATLLRHLGISVDGGAFPTTQQVNAAYKRALLRFHPDRVAALVKRDPSHQVEAEETFKLISRLKGILPPVATRFF